MTRKIQDGAALGVSMVAGALLVVGCSHAARANVQLDALFTNDMVLQRDKPTPMFESRKKWVYLLLGQEHKSHQ